MGTKQLIIGLGTGRCGTTSLSAFLNQHESVKVLHEGQTDPQGGKHNFKWTGDNERVLAWIGQLQEESDKNVWYGDIGMYFVNYVEAILKNYPDTKFICMERKKEEVVKSYLSWTEAKNHWLDHDGVMWEKDSKWDDSYPKYQVHDKTVALQHYWDEYAKKARHLQTLYPEHIRIVNLEQFNDQEERETILDFIGFQGVRHTGRILKHNTMAFRKQGLWINKFWKVKRALLGKPGQRKLLNW